ncbi:MAG TPA: tetratricopeptide repeat protein [Thermodesulfobacteriota bacterium]|nr:tetratricopeptide repeat protein [Thermodesulfobacteriota bacterium]
MGIDKENVLDAAQKYILKGQLKKAINEYLRLVEADPQDKRLHLKLGDLFSKSGEEDKAIQAYLKVATLYAEDDLNFRAISIYKKILSINPKFTDAFHKIATLYLKEGLAGNAKNYYQSILQINPSDSEAIKALKNIENPQQPREKAITPPAAAEPLPSKYPSPGKKPVPESPDLVTSHAPQSPGSFSESGASTLDKESETHYHLGIAYKEMELFDYAISEFELASSTPSMKFDCYIMLGNCYLEKGDYNKSIEYYKTCSKIPGLSNEKLARLHFNLGLAYEASGMVSAAIDTFNFVLKLDHSFSEAREKIGKLQPLRK